MSLLSLQSRRLQAAPWQRLSDAELAALFAPEVVQWLPAGFQAEGRAARLAFLTELSTQAEVAALRDQSSAHIGLLILSLPQADNIRHLGYLFIKAVWGQGLASELIAALQAHVSGSDVVLSGGVMTANAASARVLQKAGFTALAADDRAADDRAAGEGATGGGDETVYTWQAGGAAPAGPLS